MIQQYINIDNRNGLKNKHFTTIFILATKMGKKQPKQQEFTVQQIIDRKDQKTQKGTITYYKVLWEGYPEDQATWEKASSLLRSSAVKKDIEKFNNKRKNIQKIKDNLPHVKALKQNAQNLKGITQNKLSTKSLVDSKVKKTIQLESTKNQKLTSSRSQTNQKNSTNIKPTQSPKKTSQKDNVVVSKILQKMREKKTLKKREIPIPNKEKIIQLEDKMKDKIKVMPKVKKGVKPPAIINPEQLIKSKLKKSTTLKPIIEKNQTQQAVPLSETFHENQTAISPISSPQIKESSLLTVSCVNRIIDHIIEEKSSILQKEVEKPLDCNISANNESIKLELTDQLIDHVSLKEGKQSLVAIEQPNTSFQKDEFVIKGMMVCKNQYFYLVEENGKSDVLSRAVMLDKYPYELIVFYEKRINIKPAEINMMVL